MRAITSIFTIIIALCFTQPLFANTQLTAAVQLSNLLNQFTTLQANFTQKTEDIAQDVLKTSNGTVKLQRPGRFRWETLQPSHQIVITNGNTLWIYDVDLAEVTKQSIENMPINPAKVLSGDVDELLKQFTIHMIPHAKIIVFNLIPKKQNRVFHSIALAFKNDKLFSMHIQNAMKQTTVFYFSNVLLNTNLSPSLFQFTVPAGVDVLR